MIESGDPGPGIRNRETEREKKGEKDWGGCEGEKESFNPVLLNEK